MSKVIDFNKFKVEREVQRFDELSEEIATIEQFSTDFALSAAYDIAEALSELGYDVMDNPESILDMLSAVESIRAVVYRITGMEYPFHKVSDGLFREVFESKGIDLADALSDFLNDYE